ncbi:MAG: hypothetical protein RIC14_04160 [Filomicrobium sp.]
MFYQLLTTFFMGAIAAGAVFMVVRTFGWKPQAAIYLLAAAVGMMSYSVYDEYSWYERSSGALPTRMHVVRSYATSMPYQPWTYAIPRIYRFDAVDLGSTRVNPKAPDLQLVRMLRVTRNVSSDDVSTLIDCRNKRFAELGTETKFADTGVPTNADWQNLGDHPNLNDVICRGSASASGDTKS